MVRVGPFVDEEFRRLKVAVLGSHNKQGVAVVIYLVQVERFLYAMFRLAINCVVGIKSVVVVAVIYREGGREAV